MTRSYRKNTLRTFKNTVSRFAAVFAIVALGVGFLAGLNGTPIDMKESMERYMDDADFYDLRVVSTLGLTDEDVAALGQVDGVREVQPGYSADLLVEADGDTIVSRAHSLPAPDNNTINRLRLVDGRLPAASGECVVEAGAMELNPTYPIGTQLVVSSANEALDTKLDTTVTKYYRNEDLVYAAYEKGGKQMTECHLRSTHSNDLTVTYTDADGKRTGVSILCEDDKGSYRVTFDQGLNTQSPYGADRFTIWISPEADNATFNSECTYEAVYADGKLTCTLVSANYYDKKGGFKHFTHTTDKNGVTQESSQPIYNKSDANEAMIGDSVDILRHVEKWDGVEAAQVRMGTHAFSYTEKKDITYWYIDSQVRFLFRNKEKAAAFNARYGGDGVKTLKHTDAPYAVNFSRCNLQIASDCTFPGDQNLGEFAVTDFKNNPYYNVTFDADGVLTSFQKVK